MRLIQEYFLLFLIYSFFGWIVETIYVSFLNKKFVNRGFLIGPYCPIYGCGAIVIILFLSKFKFNSILLFFMSVLICGILEYMTSLIMEKVFKARWWDYSTKKMNIDGRVCLSNLIAFGILGILVMYVINPVFEKWIDLLKDDILNIVSLTAWTIFVIDLVLSTVVIYGFRKTTEKVNLEEREDNTEEITKNVRKILSEKSIFHRRFINAYPRLRAIRIKIKNIKTKIENATHDAKDAVIEKTGEIKNKISNATNDAKDAFVEKAGEFRNSIENGTNKVKSKFTKNQDNAQK